MDENTTRSLQYGHLGQAVYHPNTQSWSFLRTLSPAPRISYTGVTKTAVQSPSTSIPLSSAPKISTLSRGYPELIPGYRSAYNKSLSHIVTATSEVCNPLTSALLDIGRAVDLDNDKSGRRAVPIVAFASGECGNTISFRSITDDAVDLKEIPAPGLRVPTIGNEDAIEWMGDGAPVRQICFSTSQEERATFAAARFSSTAVFRPLYRRTPAAVATQRDSSGTMSCYRDSRLDPALLMEISSSHTGGFAHADVKFNPWDQNQLAIVDEAGNWGIWELRNQHKRNKDNWVAACVTSGSLPWVGVGEGQNGAAVARHDGWLALEWAGNEHNVIVCDRRCCMLFRLEKEQTVSYLIELGLKRESEWILGIKRSTFNPSHIFVLTTSRILWLDVSSVSIPIRGASKPPLFPRLSWRHYRDPDDTTLQLASVSVDEDFYLILFSRLSQLVLAFYCPPSFEGTVEPISGPDPFILHVPPSSKDPDDDPGSVHFSTLVFKEIAPTALGVAHQSPRTTLLKAFTVDSGFRVQESLYSKLSKGVSNGEQNHGRDILRVKHLRAIAQRRRVADSWRDFIVDDWNELGLHPRISACGIDSLAPSKDPQFKLDYTQIYAIGTGALRLSRDDEGNAESGFQALIEKFVEGIPDYDPVKCSTSRTALEIIQRTPLLDDIDSNAQYLSAFISQFTSNHLGLGTQNHFLVQPYDPFTSPSCHRAQADEIPEVDLVAIYDRLVNHWLVALPFNIPGRTRIANEKTIRLLVVDIVLAQIILIPRRSETEMDDQSTNGDGLASILPRNDLNYSSETANEQSQLEPPKTFTNWGLPLQTDSAAIPSSSAKEGFIWPDRPAEICPRFAALSAYTSFSRGGSTSQDAERILDHWKPGLDPASYSLASEDAQQEAKLKTSRRRSRKNMSQPMNALSLDSPIALPASSPIRAVRDWGSQPDSQPPMVRLQSSQVTEDLPMTQIERGAFGGRESSRKSSFKAKKKKRAAGF
ncbi:uncharacterized protein BJX67DRAFT_103742 [Aspergillus lucknowensis]|uniref:RNA polymerase I-specific transcription initiation factor RRN6-like protein n=1 Tax=Aspergillus lucknowensis TaxID=176173 RepID=A0ABR4M6I9_9EURO